MAILFDWYENPDSYDKSPEDKILHPRLRLNGSRSTDELRRDIQARCSLTETDVTAVLDAVSHVMGRELAEGRQVHLDGIGYFRVSLTTIEPVVAATKRKLTKVKMAGVKFRADQKLKNEIGTIKAKALKANEHSAKLTDKEIDRRLTNYFATRPFMTRNDFQSVCGMMRTTAMRHIRRLRTEGKLKNGYLLDEQITTDECYDNHMISSHILQNSSVVPVTVDEKIDVFNFQETASTYKSYLLNVHDVDNIDYNIDSFSQAA